jgi:hypothetical protein
MENKKSWRDVTSVHPAADLFPLMSAEELKVLGEDIKKNGMTSPVTLWVDAAGKSLLLDGRNRLDALEAVGIPVKFNKKGWCKGIPAPHKLPPDLKHLTDMGRCVDVKYTNADPYEYVLSANIHRRHLTADQKREIIAKILKAQPEKSDRQIAKGAKVDHKTVGAEREKLEARGEIPHVEMRTDTKGRKQPAKKEKRVREASAAAATANTAAPMKDARPITKDAIADAVGSEGEAKKAAVFPPADDLVDQALRLVGQMNDQQRDRFKAALKEKYPGLLDPLEFPTVLKRTA